MVQTIRDLLGLVDSTYDIYIVFFSLFMIFVTLQFFYSILAIPVNMITNAFERMARK